MVLSRTNNVVTCGTVVQIITSRIMASGILQLVKGGKEDFKYKEMPVHSFK